MILKTSSSNLYHMSAYNTFIQTMTLSTWAIKSCMFAKPVMVGHERKAIAKLMTTLKFIKMQLLFSTMNSNHRHLTTTTAGILGQLVHKSPPMMCWLKMHFALWLSLWLPNPINHLIHLVILSYMANQISPLAVHPDLLLQPMLSGPFTRLLRERLQNNPQIDHLYDHLSSHFKHI